MKKRQRKKIIQLVLQFIKLQIAGNVLFFGTMGGTFIGSVVLHYDNFYSFTVAAIISNVLYFALDRRWVFKESSRRHKGHRDIIRFILFAIVNFFINLGLVGVLTNYGFNIYIAQVLAGFFFTVWNYVGLKFWVFAPSRHHAITFESLRSGGKYDHGPQRKTK